MRGFLDHSGFHGLGEEKILEPLTKSQNIEGEACFEADDDKFDFGYNGHPTLKAPDLA